MGNRHNLAFGGLGVDLVPLSELSRIRPVIEDQLVGSQVVSHSVQPEDGDVGPRTMDIAPDSDHGCAVSVLRGLAIKLVPEWPAVCRNLAFPSAV